MKCSIVIPTYNRAQFVGAALQSVQAQTMTDWEMIVVDDGSTDDTVSIVHEFMNHDSRIHLIEQPNAGASAARNRGMGVAQGDVIIYLDSDDTARPTLLARIIATYSSVSTAQFGITNHQRQKILLDDAGQILQQLPAEIAHQTRDVRLQDLYHWKFHTTSSGLFHSRVAREQIRWDEHLPLFEDWDLLMQLGNQYPDGFVYVPDVLVDYGERYGGNGLCSSASYADWAQGFELIYQKHQSDPLLQGQDWYPQRVEKYTTLQKEFEAGRAPAPQLRHFT